MTPVLLLAVALFGAACALAFVLAAYALPFMIGLAASRFALACGAGSIAAALVGIAVGGLAFASFVYLRSVLRSPSAKLAVAAIFALPAAVAGYALMHGVISGVQLSEPLRQIVCLASGGFVAFSAAVRLATSR